MMLSLQLAMKISREIQREIYTVLMDYFPEDLGAAHGGQSSSIVDDSGYTSAIPYMYFA